MRLRLIGVALVCAVVFGATAASAAALSFPVQLGFQQGDDWEPSQGDGDVRIAWQDDRNGPDPGGDDPDARWNTYYRSSTNRGAAWSPEAQLSRFVAGYPYKFATPSDGYAEPYGDYFELDIDSAGVTHALWGEGPSYAGPGNVWYARGQ
jgi:hypothetical protein